MYVKWDSEYVILVEIQSVKAYTLNYFIIEYFNYSLYYEVEKRQYK